MTTTQDPVNLDSVLGEIAEIEKISAPVPKPYQPPKNAEAEARAAAEAQGEPMGDGDPVRYIDGSGKRALAKAEWTTAYVNDLPDSSFLYVEGGGKKDESGKTEPRSLRHFPVKDKNGKPDLPHVRNALARIPDSKVPDDKKAGLTSKARAMLGEAEKKVEKALLQKSDTGEVIAMLRAAQMTIDGLILQVAEDDDVDESVEGGIDYVIGLLEEAKEEDQERLAKSAEDTSEQGKAHAEHMNVHKAWMAEHEKHVEAHKAGTIDDAEHEKHMELHKAKMAEHKEEMDDYHASRAKTRKGEKQDVAKRGLSRSVGESPDGWPADLNSPEFLKGERGSLWGRDGDAPSSR